MVAVEQGWDVNDDRWLDDGEWLVARLGSMRRAEAEWLERLGSFDAEGRWAVDGHLSCVDWLVTKAGLARSTAFEKLRVARVLRSRPILAGAYRQAKLSYCASRAICRAEGAEADVDAALVALAEAAPVRDVELAVRAYLAHLDQERPPAEDSDRRGLRIRPTGTGYTRIEGLLGDAEADQLRCALQAVIDADDAGERGQSTRADSFGEGDDGGDGDRDDAGESTRADSDGRWAQGSAERRADALMELVAQWSAITPLPGWSSERYLTHVIVGPDGTATLADGTPLPTSEAAAVACDAPLVTHHHDGGGRVVRLGRRRRRFSPAQHLAALVRDGGRCRFPGCHRSARHLHHARWWANGGPTDLSNGVSLCARHHTLAHRGVYRIDGDADATLAFRPAADLTRLIGTSQPARRGRPPG